MVSVREFKEPEAWLNNMLVVDTGLVWMLNAVETDDSLERSSWTGRDEDSEMVRRCTGFRLSEALEGEERIAEAAGFLACWM